MKHNCGSLSGMLMLLAKRGGYLIETNHPASSDAHRSDQDEVLHGSWMTKRLFKANKHKLQVWHPLHTV